jgi:predicted ATPase/KaiC/GvpD/RAD55 family RecA-like ATPase
VTPEDRKLLKEAIHALRDEPLLPDDPRYVRLHGESDEGGDPVELMMRSIERSSGESAQLFTGFRGTGKTSALRRLQGKLVEAGYKVVFVDIEDYLNTSMIVDASDFFIALGGSFREAMTAPELLGDLSVRNDYWRSTLEFLDDHELTVRKLKAGLKSGTDMMLSPENVDTWVAETCGMLAEWVRELQVRHGDDAQVALIVDSLDHMRGTAENAQAVQRSITALFTRYAAELRLPSMHVVYTVPFHLKVRSSPEILHNLGPVRSLPAVQVRDLQGAIHLQGVNALETLISKCIDSPRLLGNGAQLEKIILSSGGNVRELQRILREVIRHVPALPASARVVDDAIEHMRTGLLSLVDEDQESLARIAHTHDLDIERKKDAYDVSRWEDAHLVLQYRNGRDWYDIHPLIRDVVLQRARERSAEAQPSASAEPTPVSPRLPQIAAATTAPGVLTPEMRVTLVVESYRALRRVRWTLPRGVSALVGPNGSGKTTLLDIPELLRHALQHDVRTAIDERGGPGNLRNAQADRNAPVILGVELDELTWQLDLAPRGASFSPLQGERATVGDAIAFDRNKPVPGLETRTDDTRPLLARFVDLAEGAALSPLVSLLRGYRLYHAYDLASIRVNGSQLSSDEYLHPDGRNIFSVLRNWRDRKETRPRWEFVIESLRAAFPDTFADLDFDMAGQTVSGRIVAPQPDVRIATYFAANGWLVALLHLAAVASTERAGAVAIDEMENGLHPYAIREIIDAMRRWAEERGISVVLATHSPVVLDQFKEEPWNLFVMEPGRETAPVALDELHDPEWLAHFSLGDLYAHDEFGAQHKDDQRVV